MKAAIYKKYGTPEVQKIVGDHSFFEVRFNETDQYRSIKGEKI